MSIISDLKARNVSEEAIGILKTQGLDVFETLTTMNFGTLITLGIKGGDAGLVAKYITEISAPDEAYAKLVAIKPDETGRFLIDMIPLMSDLTPKMLLKPNNDLKLIDIDGWLIVRLALGNYLFTKAVCDRLLIAWEALHPATKPEKTVIRQELLKAFRGTDEQFLNLLSRNKEEFGYSDEMVGAFRLALASIEMLRASYKLSEEK